MAGGKAQKSMIAKAENMKKQMGAKGSQLEWNKTVVTNQEGKMAGGKAQKSIIVKEENMKKQMGVRGSELELNKTVVIVQLSMQTFTCTLSERRYLGNAKSKHPKTDINKSSHHLKK